jgi:hypothetical protein
VLIPLRVLFVRIPSTIQQVCAFLALATLLAIMFVLSWPRLLSSLQILPVQQVQGQLYKPAVAQTLDLSRLQDRTRRAISYHDAYAYHSFGSLLAYVQASGKDVSLYSKQNLLNESIAEAKLALAGAPLQPDLWLRIAQAGAQTFIPGGQVEEYFYMAIWSGRVEPTHLIGRIHLGFALLQLMDDDGISLFRDQVLLAWNLQQAEFRRAVRSGQLNYHRVVALMTATHPDVVREMEEVFGPVTL